MKIIQNTPLAPLTSFNVGGLAEQFAIVKSTEELLSVLNRQPEQLTMLGYGTNNLISDKGLKGLTVALRSSRVEWKDDGLVLADAGTWWDDFVSEAVAQQMWGLELMSGIPGGVGGAIVGNIAAYGQAVADTLEWIEVIDLSKKPLQIERMEAQELDFGYRYSILQLPEHAKLVVVRAAFKLSSIPTKQLRYQAAIDVANEYMLPTNHLQSRRTIIIEARRRAGSLQDKNNHGQKTGGSFFRNPIVTREQAERVMGFEERPITRDQILQQNTIHGGNSLRVPAALVLLAAGFKRGQQWGNVRLHPNHLQKIENAGNATAQEIYDVAMHLIATTQQKLAITLQPEVRILGEFDPPKPPA